MNSLESSDTCHTRVAIYDALRGFSVISMVLFHYCYDLKYLSGTALEWFAPPLQDIWRCSISWAFLFIAGCMCAHSKNNLKRGAQYLLVALLIFVVTTIAAVDTPINFGIIFCMGACTLCAWVLEQLNISPKGYLAALICFACFLVSLPLAHGYLGLGVAKLALPRAPYSFRYLAWLGFPGPSFASGDYYPLLPYVCIFPAAPALRTGKLRVTHSGAITHMHDHSSL